MGPAGNFNLVKVILSILFMFTLSILIWYLLPCSVLTQYGVPRTATIDSDKGIQTLIVGNLILDGGQFVIKNRSHYDRLRVSYGVGEDFIDGFKECSVPSRVSDDIVDTVCVEIPNKIKLTVTHSRYDLIDCYDIEWTSLSCGVIPMDCMHMSNSHWYGGSANVYQQWPIERLHMSMQPYVTLRDASVLERYWLNSRGVGIKVDDFIPLHVSMNNDDMMLCLKSEYDSIVYSDQGWPFLKLSYQVCLGNDVKTTHQFMSRRHFDLPKGMPNEDLLRYPIWTTWPTYAGEINESSILEFADNIDTNWFSKGQFEIDSFWSNEYGDFEFSPDKFPNPRGMVDHLHSMGFLVSVWISPFASIDSYAFREGLEKKYWILDRKSQTPALVKWPNSAFNNIGGLLDVTNPDAVDWFLGRLEKLRHDIGIDTFKCKGGEVYYLPNSYTNSHPLRSPNEYSTKYVEMVARLGDRIDVNLASKTHKLSVLVRTFNKNPYRNYNNGIKSIIPTALTTGILGYPFVLLDMVGGDAWEQGDLDGDPDRELFIRWVQLSAYLPVMKFSVCPWEFNSAVIDITRKMVEIHEQVVTPIILRAAHDAIKSGKIIHPPLTLAVS
ncbi:myogenesis-regulating glycosidase-like [Saccoglossus kowalevskii]|uniref:Uncharacterized family 31 glucosidase KIAA1161-like n=1 Tax=Saccoglossus kowalevskii TaxID=10224 RepID=A0ABM0MJ36_SACKO|nr:PREDICTED: uncharacterized family 31 glucosidase KIAA1161-like [Saccoglossus kowalevskii]